MTSIICCHVQRQELWHHGTINCKKIASASYIMPLTQSLSCSYCIASSVRRQPQGLRSNVTEYLSSSRLPGKGKGI